MKCFEFLHGLTIISFALNISENLHWQHLFKRLEEAETHHLRLCQCNIIPTHPEEQHLPFKQIGTPPFFHSDTNPVFGHVPFHSVDKTHVLVVTVELIWLLFLNILSFNFAPTPNKSLRLTPFRRSYVNNHTTVILILLKLYDCFLWIGFNCLKTTETLRGDSLLFTAKFPENPGTHLINLGRMKGWVDLGGTQWFWTQDPWIEIQCLNH